MLSSKDRAQGEKRDHRSSPMKLQFLLQLVTLRRNNQKYFMVLPYILLCTEFSVPQNRAQNGTEYTVLFSEM